MTQMVFEWARTDRAAITRLTCVECRRRFLNIKLGAVLWRRPDECWDFCSDVCAAERGIYFSGVPTPALERAWRNDRRRWERQQLEGMCR